MKDSVDQLLAGAPIYCVYVLHGRKHVLYIGRTASMRIRLTQHLKGRFGPKITAVDVYSGYSKGESYDLEYRLIQTLNPKYNRVYQNRWHHSQKIS